MKKIINKKLYDTSTATCIAEYSGPARVSDFSFYRETLYRKRTGEYFIHGEGGARSRYASYEYGLMSWGEQILPLTYDTADKARRAAAASGCSISEYVEHALLAQLGGDTDA